MRIRTILSLAFACVASFATAAPYSGAGIGTSTVGTLGGEDYASLNAAVAAANAIGTRDASTWTFSFTSDLTEPTNSALGVTVDPAGAIVFKPAVAATPTITFTLTSDNAGVSGNWLIGTQSLATANTSAARFTNNLTIDGSNTVGGTTRDLTFTNLSTIVHSFSMPVVVFGDCDNFTIKNTRLINLNTGIVASVSAIGIRPRYEVSPFVADNLTIQNCLLRSTDSQQGHAINVTSNGAVVGTGAPSGYNIIGNDIEARIRGVFANPMGGGTFTQNNFKIGLTGTSNAFDTFGIIWNGIGNMTGQTINVTRNRVEIQSDNQGMNFGPTGFFMASMGASNTCNVINNLITVKHNQVGPDPGAGFVGKTRAIFGSSGINYNIHNNSARVSANYTGRQLASQSFGIGGYGLAGTIPDTRNNIVRISTNGGAAINQNVTPTVFTSDYNILSAPGGNAYGRVANTPAAFTFHNRAISSGVATISTGTGTTAQAHALVVGDQVVLAPTLGINFHNRSITGGVATISTGTGTTAQAHTLVVGDQVFINHTTTAANPTGPKAAYDGLRTITAVTASTFSFATAGADDAALGTAATQGAVVRWVPGIAGGPYTVTAVTASNFSYATAAADLAALGTAATQGNYYRVDTATTSLFPTLAAWNTAVPAADANSDSFDPETFWVSPVTSPTDLHLNANPPGFYEEWGGVTIALVGGVDYDGDTRHDPDAYRGGDEQSAGLVHTNVADWTMIEN